MDDKDVIIAQLRQENAELRMQMQELHALVVQLRDEIARLVSGIAEDRPEDISRLEESFRTATMGKHPSNVEKSVFAEGA